MAKPKQTKQIMKPVKKYLELLYMSPSTVTARDLAKVLRDIKDIKIEIWDEMNVLEFELPSMNTVDVEPMEVYFKDPSDAAFVKNRGIQTIFAVTLAEEDLPIVKACFEHIVEQYLGFLCTDSQDFNPVYVGSLLPTKEF